MKESLTVVKLSFCCCLDLLNHANYFFLANNALIFAPRVLKKFPIAVKPFFNIAPKSAKVFLCQVGTKKIFENLQAVHRRTTTRERLACELNS